MEKMISWSRAVALLGVMLAVAGCSLVRAGEPAYHGTVLEPAEPATNFALQDQRGGTFRLADAKGEVVVLTFLYTSCTDTCPFIAVKLKQAAKLLGEDANNVEFVVISTDPKRDTLERVAEYSRALGLYDRWHYLIGVRDRLAPIWKAYYVGATVGEEAVEGEEETVSGKELQQSGLLKGLDDPSVQLADEVLKKFGGGYEVQHSTPVWLIDAQGQIRVKHGQDLVPSDLVHDVRQLLKQG